MHCSDFINKHYFINILDIQAAFVNTKLIKTIITSLKGDIKKYYFSILHFKLCHDKNF